MKMWMCILGLVLASWYGCKEEEVLTWDPYVYPEVPDTPYIWQVNLTIDTQRALAMRPFVYADRIFCAAGVGFDPFKFFMVNTDGVKFWVSGEEFEENCNEPPIPPNSSFHQYDELLIYLCDSDPRAVDLSTGNLVWHTEIPGGDQGPFMTAYGDKLFHTYTDGPNPFYKSTLMIGDIQTQQWDSVFYIDMFDNWSVDLYPPGVQVQDDGDTILLFHCRMWNDEPSYTERTDVYAYNMTADSIVWVIEDIDPAGGSTVWSPVIYNDKAYFQGAYSLFCIDVATGNILWTWETPGFGDDLNMTGPYVFMNKVYLCMYSGKVVALNPETGEELWLKDDFGFNPSTLTGFDGVLYFTSEGSGKLFAVESATGATRWELESPNKNDPDTWQAAFTNPVTIDPMSQLLYLTDRYFLMCIPIK